MHILCVYQHYANFDCANSGRLFTLLEHLGKNHKISLISSDHWMQHRMTDLYPWVPENVDWMPVRVPYANSMTSLQRLRAYTQFPYMATRLGRKLSPDMVYGISTPLTTGWAARKLARKHKVPFVFEIRDLWPDFPIEMGAITNRYAQRKLYDLEKGLYHDANHVVTVSPDMTEHVRSCGIPPDRVTTLLQGTNIDLADEALKVQASDEFDFGGRHAVLYAGTFGRANAIPTVLDVAKRLEDHNNIVFVFTGEGYHGKDILDASLSSNNVILLPPIPRHRIMHLFHAASQSIVPFSNLPVLNTNSPAKFFDSLAVGTPVLVTNPGWTKNFVEEHQCGTYAPIDSPKIIAESILRAANSSDNNTSVARNGMTVARAMFDRTVIAQQLEGIFVNLVDSGI